MGRRVFLQAGTIGAYCDLEGIDFAAHLADVERVQAIIRRGVDQ